MFATIACTTTSGGDWTPTKDPQTGKVQTGASESELIYSVAGQALAMELGQNGQLVLVQETLPVTKKHSLSFPQDYAGIHRYLDKVSQPCATSFIKANKQRYPLASPGMPSTTIRTTTMSHVNQLLQTGGWKALVVAYPNTKILVSVARPGVCAEHQEALVYLMSTHADGSSDGILVQAKRSSEGWKVAKQVVITHADGLVD